MKVLGLITEYNPFHNGHLYHLNKSKELTQATHTITVMSGNFLQRGEAALMDKWARAHGALNNGVDLVLELPLAYACRSAQGFAFGAVSILEKTGLTDALCFGSEVGDINPLQVIAKVILEEPLEYQSLLRKHLDTGTIFPAARSQALMEYLINYQEHLNLSVPDFTDKYLSDLSQILSSPNNVLGIEYLRALLLLNSEIKPFTIARKIAGYHDVIDENSLIASATGIRLKTKECQTAGESLASALEQIEKYIPKETYQVITEQIELGKFPVWTENMTLPLFWQLRKAKGEDLKKILDINEGIENLILEGANLVTNYHELITFLKTRRYTLTRIKRILLYILINYTKEMAESFDALGGPQYLRVLGFNEKGREILKRMRSTATLPIITLGREAKSLSAPAQQMFKLDVLGTDLYSLLYPKQDNSTGAQDYLQKPIIID